MRLKMRFWGQLLLLVIWIVTDSTDARPQTREISQDGERPIVSSGTSRLTNEERAFFAPGSWQPIPSQVSGLIIDEAPSRVRVEKYENSLRDSRSKEEVLDSPIVQMNGTGNTTTRGKSPTPLGDAIKMVASQLMQSRGGVAESDVRAPPPKNKKAQSNNKKTDDEDMDEAETSHHGVAIPVIIEDTEQILAAMAKEAPTTKKTTTLSPSKKTHSTTGAYEKKTQSTPSQKKQQPTTKKPTAAALRSPVTSIPDGLTTWVFLSGSSPATLLATTPSSPSLTKPMTSGVTTKKTQRIATTQATPSEKTHNVVKKPSPLFTSSGTKPNRMTKKPVVVETVTVAGSKNKNKEGSSPAESKDKPTASRLEGEKHEVIAFRRRPSTSEVEATPASSTYKPLPTAYPLSTAATDEGSAESAESAEDESTEVVVPTEDLTKRTRPAGEKKKKKNKNKRRRRPVVKQPQPEEEDEDELESKIEGDDDEEEGNTKTPVKGKPSRPLSTRIYNYLAREIMPSVGVGLIGLVGLAGLAGLIMYPFGGGALPIRRNYNETPKPNYYYYENDEGGQSEEEVLGKVLAGMKDPSYVVGDQTYQEPESRKPAQGDAAYTRYDVGGRIANHQEVQPIRSEYDVTGRLPAQTREASTRLNGHQDEQAVQYDSEVGSRVSGSTRVGGHQDVQPVNYESDVASRVAGQNKEVVIQGSVHSDDNYGSEVGGRVTSQNKGSQRLGEGEGVAVPVASALYATRSEPRPVFNNDWSMVKTDAQEAVSSNTNHHELKYGSDADAIYGHSAQREERLRYDTVQSPQYSGVSRVGVGQKRTVEHGPRRLRRDVIKKDSAKEDQTENEIIDLEVSDNAHAHSVERVEVEDTYEDETKVTKAPPKKDLGLALKKTTPFKLDNVEIEMTTDGKITITEENTDTTEGNTETSFRVQESSEKIEEPFESSTENKNNNNDVMNDSGEDETTTGTPIDVTTSAEENITLETESPEDPSLLGLIRRVAQYKIRLGLSFLRNTSQAFSRYLEGMQKRVENIVKENAKNRNRLQKMKATEEDYYY